MYDSNRSRREFLQLLATISAIPAMSNCGSRDEAALTSRLNLYGTGTLDILDSGWAKLKEDHGIELRFTDNGNDTGPVIAQMLTGTASRDYQLGGLQGGAERELAGAGSILAWDTSRLSNWSTMWPMAKQIPYTIVSGEQYGLPIALNADSVIYLPNEVKEVQGYEDGVVDSYYAVFDDRFRGRASMEDAWINSVIFTAIYLKYQGVAIGDPGNLTESELRETMEFLIERKKSGQFRKLWQGWEQGVELLSSGEVCVMTGWEPIVYELRRRGINAEYARPKEGYEGWSNDLLLHAGTADQGLLDEAHCTADWLLDGYYGCNLADLRGYAVPNDTSIEYARRSEEFDEARVRELTEHVQRKFQVGGGETHWQNVRPRNYRLYEEWWSRLRNA